MTKYIHIDQNVNILTGEAAKMALETENDRVFLSEKDGIFHVSAERWKTAQTTERKHWMELGLSNGNDRNDQHYGAFDNYRALRGLKFQNAIELGCGPFTNLRLIANVAEIAACTLLDPLIETYLSHPNCFYTREVMFRDLPVQVGPIPLSKLWREAGRFPGVLSRVRRRRKIPVRRIIAEPIETMPVSERYDLVVIINVLEHCYDVREVVARILAIMKPGSILVFHDKLYDHEMVKETVVHEYDAAHPLQVDRGIILSFLEQNFIQMYRRVDRESCKVLGEMHSFDGLYYMGRKIQSPGSDEGLNLTQGF